MSCAVGHILNNYAMYVWSYNW